MIPLQRTILYSADSYINHYWTAVRNTTEWNVVMNELVLSGNELAQLMLQGLPPSMPGAHLGPYSSLSENIVLRVVADRVIRCTFVLQRHA